jgi:hypothetical protein
MFKSLLPESPTSQARKAEIQELCAKLTALGPGPWPLTRPYLESYLLLTMDVDTSLLALLEEPHEWVGQGPDPTDRLIQESQASLAVARQLYMTLPLIPDADVADWWCARMGLRDGAVAKETP